jgi:hypothetical protein
MQRKLDTSKKMQELYRRIVHLYKYGIQSRNQVHKYIRVMSCLAFLPALPRESERIPLQENESSHSSSKSGVLSEEFSQVTDAVILM